MLEPRIYQRMKSMPKKLPSSGDYGDLLQIAYMYINHNYNELRKAYGGYTYGDWHTLLRRYKVNMTKYKYRLVGYVSERARRSSVEEFFDDKREMLNHAQTLNLPRIEYYKSVGGLWKQFENTQK